jgi:hypothetical protein
MLVEKEMPDHIAQALSIATCTELKTVHAEVARRVLGGRVKAAENKLRETQKAVREFVAGSQRVCSSAPQTWHEREGAKEQGQQGPFESVPKAAKCTQGVLAGGQPTYVSEEYCYDGSARGGDGRGIEPC